MPGKGLEIFWIRSWMCLVTSSGRENVAEGSHKLFVKYCHTRSNLGISAVLEILQSYTVLSYILKLAEMYLEDVRKISRRCVEGV